MNIFRVVNTVLYPFFIFLLLFSGRNLGESTDKSAGSSPGSGAGTQVSTPSTDPSKSPTSTPPANSNGQDSSTNQYKPVFKLFKKDPNNANNTVELDSNSYEVKNLAGGRIDYELKSDANCTLITLDGEEFWKHGDHKCNENLTIISYSNRKIDLFIGDGFVEYTKDNDGNWTVNLKNNLKTTGEDTAPDSVTNPSSRTGDSGGTGGGGTGTGTGGGTKTDGSGTDPSRGGTGTGSPASRDGTGTGTGGGTGTGTGTDGSGTPESRDGTGTGGGMTHTGGSSQGGGGTHTGSGGGSPPANPGDGSQRGVTSPPANENGARGGGTGTGNGGGTGTRRGTQQPSGQPAGASPGSLAGTQVTTPSTDPDGTSTGADGSSQPASGTPTSGATTPGSGAGSGTKTGIELSLKATAATDQFEYKKERKVVTYTAKDTYGFKSVKTGDTVVWSTDNASEYATKVVLNGKGNKKKEVTIELPNGTKKVYNRENKNKPWNEESYKNSNGN